MSVNAGNLSETDPDDLAGDLFTRIPEVLSWNLEPSVDEPDAFRTADTGGTNVTPCGGAVEWTVTVNTKICLTNWLYDALLDPAFKVPATTGWYQGSKPYEVAWFYLSFNGLGPTTDTAVTDHGIYLTGRITPPGIGGDNNTNEAAEAEFTIQVINGPYFPNL
jgi:hypothetical protein